METAMKTEEDEEEDAENDDDPGYEPNKLPGRRQTREASSDDGYDQIGRSGGDLLCVVCGDTATGRHYGTIACNGCKGFFRRTIRRAYKYTCRFNGHCSIDKHTRAVCRACRFSRCINSGMKVDAVQNERDVIGKRGRAPTAIISSPSTSTSRSHRQTPQPSSSSSFVRVPSTSPVSSLPSASTVSSQTQNDGWDQPKQLLESLLRSENTIQSLRDTVIKQTGSVEYSTKPEPENQNNTTQDGERKATVNDIFKSIHSQLLLVIEWAKTLPPFLSLSTEDQTALLKNFASQHVVLCVSYRSINAPDFLKLINNSCIPRSYGLERDDLTSSFYSKDCDRVLDQMVAPMRFMKLDDVEFVAIKACVLFNPIAKGLSKESVMTVLNTRRKIFAALQHYVDQKIPHDQNRIGDLTFFILTPLVALANSMSEDVLVMTKLSGEAQIDQLMEELILRDTEEQKFGDIIPKESAKSPISEPSSTIPYAPNVSDDMEISTSSAMYSNYTTSTTMSSYPMAPVMNSPPTSPTATLLGSSSTCSPPIRPPPWNCTTFSSSDSSSPFQMGSIMNF